MIKEAIQKILEIAGPQRFDIDGRTFLLSAGQIHREVMPGHTSLESCSLDGLCQYAQRFFADKKEDSVPFIHVQDPSTVVLYSAKNKDGKHQAVYVAKAKANKFPFGERLSLEEMIIKLRCCFAENDDLRSLISGISAITSGPVTTAVDDGISQTVTVKAGVSMKSEAKINPVRDLIAFRSFAGIESPISSFLFRVHQDKDSGTARFSLHDMEGDRWIAETLSKIQREIFAKCQGKIDVY